jgi:hypothetical protein
MTISAVELSVDVPLGVLIGAGVLLLLISGGFALRRRGGASKGDDDRDRDHRLAWQWLVGIAALALGFAAVVVDDFQAEDAAIALVALVVGSMIIGLRPADWKQLVSRVQGAKFGGFEVALTSDAIEASKTSALSLSDSEPLEEEEKEKVHRLVDLQMTLESRIAFVVKHLLPDKEKAYANIGSLNYDRYLTREDAVAARRLLALRESDLSSVPGTAADSFLKESGEYVYGFRSQVFHGMVLKELERLAEKARKDEATTASATPRPGLRRPAIDVVLHTTEKRRLVVYALLTVSGSVYGKEGKLLEKAGSIDENEATNAKRVIVIPDSSTRAALNLAGADSHPVPIITFAALRSAETLEGFIGAVRERRTGEDQK